MSPALQLSWDWRAAANFMAGGTGSGLYLAAFFASLSGPSLQPLLLLGLMLVAAGLGCVWLEIGRPWRFLNVFHHPQRSWMTREAMAACGLFALAFPAIIFGSVVLAIGAALCAAAFLYSQARIIERSKGIPAWREPAVVPLIVATGLSEGVGLLAVVLTLAGALPGAVWPLQATLLVLLAARYFGWRRYRRALNEKGAPTGTIKVLDAATPSFVIAGHALPALLIVLSVVAGFMGPVLLGLAGVSVFATGWLFKFVLITRAAFNQGYAIERMPARGGGDSAPGIQPGWTVS
ncbi:MAG: polysulfide reductase NrfD [Hyphomicrobiales bacterium]|nr:polysulfide reductase NrfD [Hyphomicrobiales bacterium]MCP4998840.1 polysulfide reductase NrfD [Hyphomicrobiales bacterium]